MRSRVVPMLLLSFGVLAEALPAQSLEGRISGRVTDVVGGVVVGASVVVVNDDTGFTREAITDDTGFYVFANLPGGPYTVRTALHGFKQAVKAGYVLGADGRLSVDFMLEPGAVAETIEVTARAAETVNTTSGELSRVVDREQVENLAMNTRNYIHLTSVIPGVPLTGFDAIDQTITNSANVPVNGSRGDTNNVMVDGGFNLSKANNTQQSHSVGLDFIQELRIQTSNFSAEYGRQSGAAINVVTRAGTNRFRGSAFEFVRNEALDARNFFAVREKRLRFNNFGWSLGGPIRRGKAFFFAGQEWRTIRRDASPVRRTLPTRAERRGDFQGRRGNLFFPGTQTSIPNRDLSALVTANGRAIAAVYDAMEGMAIAYDDRPVANNAIFQPPAPYGFRQEIVRIDYRFTDRQSAYARFLHDHTDLQNPFGTNISSALPTVPTRRVRPATSLLVSHSWMAGRALVNEVKASATWFHFDVVPQGDVWQRATYGFAYGEFFDDGRYAGGLPVVTVSGFAGFEGPSGANAARSGDMSFADNLTWVRGRHTLKTGIVYIRTRNDQHGRVTDDYLGIVSFNAAGNRNTTGNAFADALLGNYRTYTESSTTRVTPFRSENYEAYASDNWKVSSRLSIEAGVRYQAILPLYTTNDALSTFEVARYDPSRAVTVLPNGAVAPGSGDPFNGLVRAGDGSRGSKDPAILVVPAGAPRGLTPVKHRVAPRFSFAFAPLKDARSAIRGGIGIFYDSPRGDITQRASASPPFTRAVQVENGNLAALGADAGAAAPFGEVLSVDPHLDAPYTVSFSLGVQRELARGVLAEVAYVGTVGRHLIRRPDINHAPFAVLAANAARPSTERTSVNALRPYRGYSMIRQSLSDAGSDYHALQIYVVKRKGDLTMTGSYTWSKALTDASGADANPEEPENRRFNYGPATFDRRHIVVSTYTYRLPWLRRRRGVIGTMLGGWEVSGITRLQSGQFRTVTGSTSIGTRRADYVGGRIDLPRGERTPDRHFNTGAFRPAPNTRRGTAGVGTVEGPGLHVWDLSLRKRVPLGRAVRAQLQADFFNAFNRANFDGLNINASNADFGSYTSAAPGRSVQLGVRITF